MHIRNFLIGAALLLLASCDIETSDNGKLDGFWHLERVDTLATGGVTDYSNMYVFWGVQKDLIFIKDTGSDVASYYLRFNQTADNIDVTRAYLNNAHEDNPNVDQGGDIPVEVVDDALRRLGINEIPESFRKETLNSKRMVLATEKLRLWFKRF